MSLDDGIGIRFAVSQVGKRERKQWFELIYIDLNAAAM